MKDTPFAFFAFVLTALLATTAIADPAKRGEGKKASVSEKQKGTNAKVAEKTKADPKGCEKCGEAECENPGCGKKDDAGKCRTCGKSGCKCDDCKDGKCEKCEKDTHKPGKDLKKDGDAPEKGEGHKHGEESHKHDGGKVQPKKAVSGITDKRRHDQAATAHNARMMHLRAAAHHLEAAGKGDLAAGVAREIAAADERVRHQHMEIQSRMEQEMRKKMEAAKMQSAQKVKHAEESANQMRKALHDIRLELEGIRKQMGSIQSRVPQGRGRLTPRRVGLPTSETKDAKPDNKKD